MASLALAKTVGDNYNTSCPHCGKINHNIVHGVNISLGTLAVFSKPCFYCNEAIRYHARYEIIIEAYTKDPLK